MLADQLDSCARRRSASRRARGAIVDAERRSCSRTVAANSEDTRRLNASRRTARPSCVRDRRNGQLRRRLGRFLGDKGELVFEVDRPRRPARRDRAKTDEIDAIRAAAKRLTASGSRDRGQSGEREALRALLATRETA